MLLQIYIADAAAWLSDVSAYCWIVRYEKEDGKAILAELPEIPSLGLASPNFPLLQRSAAADLYSKCGHLVN